MSSQWQTPPRPFPIRLLNRLGKLGSAAGMTFPELSEKAVLKAAQRATGLSDIGDPGCLQGLQQLCSGLNNEAQLTQIGRLSARETLVTAMTTRMRLVDYARRNPEMHDEEIREPLFISGLPRTGTTILQLLLAEDPKHRSPKMWEMQRPFPKPGVNTVKDEQTIREVEKGADQLDMLSPGFKAIHETEARLPEECLTLFTSAFFQEQFSTVFDVPSYREWFMNADALPAYRWHKQFLQYLQHKHKIKRWVLKSPLHLPFLNTIFKVYPDARVIQTHRDPMEVMASVSSLFCSLRSAFSDDVDPRHTGTTEARFLASVLQRGAGQRAELDLPERFYDMQFADIIERPIDAIEKMYAYFKIPFSPEIANTMQRYLDARPRDKHGTHSYSLDTFGLSSVRHGQLFQLTNSDQDIA